MYLNFFFSFCQISTLSLDSSFHKILFIEMCLVLTSQGYYLLYKKCVVPQCVCHRFSSRRKAKIFQAQGNMHKGKAVQRPPGSSLPKGFSSSPAEASQGFQVHPGLCSLLAALSSEPRPQNLILHQKFSRSEDRMFLS